MIGVLLMARLQPHAGRSLIEIYWSELDEILDRLMDEGAPQQYPEDGKSWGIAPDWQAYGEQRGQAQGVAYCIAVMTNPYTPDVDAIREEAMERWEKRNGE